MWSRKSAAILAVLTLAGALAHADGAWKECGHKDGILVEKRSVDGSKFYEYRGTGHVPLAPEVALERIWDGVLTENPSTVTKRTLIRRSGDEMVIHDRIHTPVVSDRELTTKLHKIDDAANQRFEIQFQSAPELGPPPDPKLVRLTVVRGQWHIEGDAGGSKVSYQVYSEPGGSVPAFLVRGTLQDETVKELERVLARLRR